MAPFSPFSIAADEYRWLRCFCLDNGIERVLEFGPGVSTYAFLEAGCSVVSLESDPCWLYHYSLAMDRMPVRLLGYENLEKLDLEQVSGDFDLAFVDGPPAQTSLPNSKPFARWNSVEFATAKTSLILMHDAYRQRERQIASRLRHEGWLCDLIPTTKGLYVFRKSSVRARFSAPVGLKF